MIPLRNAAGFSNHGPDDPLAKFGIIDPSRYHYWFSDFHRSEGIEAATANDWTITSAGGGAVALADEDGGVITLTNTAGASDNFFVQKLGESFLWEATKKLAILGRFKMSDATLSTFVFGLQVTDTAPLDVDDGIFFYKASASTTLTARVEKNDAASAANVLTMANDTYVEVAIVYPGKPFADQNGTTTYPFKIYYKDSGGIWRQTTTIDATANAPDDEELTISFGSQNGEGVGKVMSLDYAFFCKER
ncbi:MAG: hypothetical protein NUW01_08420 [Gemmatimonadaceae bacterium]|nr:hypothetical protein [Gemmatimonadaceae bacterium]